MWTPLVVTTSYDSTSTPSLSHTPSLTNSLSGDQTIQMSSFIVTTSLTGQFGTYGKMPLPSSDLPLAQYAYTVQPTAMLDIDPSSGLLFLSYVSQGINMGFASWEGPSGKVALWEDRAKFGLCQSCGRSLVEYCLAIHLYITYLSTTYHCFTSISYCCHISMSHK